MSRTGNKWKKIFKGIIFSLLVGHNAVQLLQCQEPSQVKKRGLNWSEPVPLDMSIFHGSYTASFAIR